MYLCCRHCRSPISQKLHIVTVPGADGTVGAYVNPHGVVHQTVTVRELVNDDCILYDPQPPTTEDTWFPNYAWRIAYCRT
jgi:cereblon